MDITKIAKLNDESTTVFKSIIAQLEKESKNYCKIDNSNGAFMPVYVEYLYDEDLNGDIPGGKLYSIAHYYNCNGDRMRDPDVEFIFDGKNVYPTYFMQDGIFTVREEVFRYNDKDELEYKADKGRDITEFCNMWMMNIKEQQDL